MKKLTLLVFLLLSVPLTSLAWDREGHLAVTTIAYTRFTPSQRLKIDAILRSHPSYNQWRTEFQQSHPPQLTLAAFAFIRAAAWPDDIRGNPQFHHGNWHFVNFPVRPPDFLNLNSPIGIGILHTQLQVCLNDVQNETSPTTAHRVHRAIMLSWVLHLIGDLHQPLHSVALVNQRYPQGDRGGNDFFIRPTAQLPQTDLHTFWDHILGSSETVADAVVLAGQLMQQLPFNDALVTGDYHAWINGAAQIALESVYQFRSPGGQLQPIQDQGAVLPADYEVRARRIAGRQVALAGYRLGQTLSQLLGP